MFLNHEPLSFHIPKTKNLIVFFFFFCQVLQFRQYSHSMISRWTYIFLILSFLIKWDANCNTHAFIPYMSWNKNFFWWFRLISFTIAHCWLLGNCCCLSLPPEGRLCVCVKQRRCILNCLIKYTKTGVIKQTWCLKFKECFFFWVKTETNIWD